MKKTLLPFAVIAMLLASCGGTPAASSEGPKSESTPTSSQAASENPSTPASETPSTPASEQPSAPVSEDQPGSSEEGTKGTKGESTQSGEQPSSEAQSSEPEVRYLVTYTESADFAVTGLKADGYLKGETVSFGIEVKNTKKVVDTVMAGAKILTANNGVYSFEMGEANVALAIRLKDREDLKEFAAVLLGAPEKGATVKVKATLDAEVVTGATLQVLEGADLVTVEGMNLTLNELGDVKLKVAVKDSGIDYDAELSFTITEPVTLTTLETIQGTAVKAENAISGKADNYYYDEVITIEAIVLANGTGKNVLVYDGTGYILVFDGDLQKLDVGTKVRITGLPTRYSPAGKENDYWWELSYSTEAKDKTKPYAMSVVGEAESLPEPSVLTNDGLKAYQTAGSKGAYVTAKVKAVISNGYTNLYVDGKTGIDLSPLKVDGFAWENDKWYNVEGYLTNTTAKAHTNFLPLQQSETEAPVITYELTKLGQLTATDVEVRGKVVAKNTKAFVLADDTGAAMVYLNNAPEYAIGDYLSVKESLSAGSIKNCAYQFTTAAIIEKLEGTAPEVAGATPLTAAIADSWKEYKEGDIISPADTKLYSWTTTVEAITGDDGKAYQAINIAGSETLIEPQYLPEGLKLESGKTYDVEGYFLGYSYNHGYAPFMLTKADVNGSTPTSITLNKTEASLKVGQSLQLTVTAAPEEASNAVNWLSTDPEKVSVDENGKVTALAVTETPVGILATSKLDNSVQARAIITVVEGSLYGDAEHPTTVAEVLDICKSEVGTSTSNITKQVVTTRGIVVTKPTANSYGDLSFYIADEKGATEKIEVGGLKLADGQKAPVLNDTVVVSGYACYYSGHYEFYYKNNTQVSLVSRVAGTSAITVEGDENVTVTGLPQTATNDETVEFTVVAKEGFVLDSVSLNSAALTPTEGKYSFVVAGDAKITILSHEEGGIAQKSSVMSYTGGSTTNMDGTNQAALLGLDATVFEVIGIKNSGGNNVGLNKDGTIRLYGGNKTTLKITGLKADIVSIFVEVSADSVELSNAVVKVDGGDALEDTNGVYAVAAAKGKAITIEDSASGQLRISKITITYTDAE